MLEIIVQIKSIGRFQNYSDIRELILFWVLSGEFRLKHTEVFTGRLV